MREHLLRSDFLSQSSKETQCRCTNVVADCLFVYLCDMITTVVEWELVIDCIVINHDLVIITRDSLK